MSAQANHQSPENSVSSIQSSRARPHSKLNIPTQNSTQIRSINIRLNEEQKQQEVVVPNHLPCTQTGVIDDDRIRSSNRFQEPSTGSTGCIPFQNPALFSSFSPLISNNQNLYSKQDVAPSRSAFTPVASVSGPVSFSGAPQHLINNAPAADQQIPRSNNLGILAINTMQQVQELIAINNSLLKLQAGQQMLLSATSPAIFPFNLDTGMNPVLSQSLEEDCNCPLQIKIQKQLQRRSLSRCASLTVKNQSLQLEMIHRILQNQAILDKLSIYMSNQANQSNHRKISDKIKLKIKQAQADMIYFLSEIPDPDALVLRGQPRGKVRSNGEPFTSSEFRGVCKNGIKYQMFIMIDGKKKMYLGGFETAQAAGRAYDRAAIQLRGIKAHTNHDYTKREALEILASEPIFKVYHRNEMPEVPQV